MQGKVRIGFAPTRRNVFDPVEAGRLKQAVEAKLRAWGVDYVNLDSLNDEGLLYRLADAESVARYFLDQRVDAIFLCHCNFGTEDASAKLAKLVGKPVLLWGPRDDAPERDGTRKRDTQCGLFATAKALRRLGVPFTYLTNSWVDSPEFAQGFQAFLRVVAAQRAVRGARIGQLSTRPKLFWSVMVNEGELLERFGVEMVPATLMELKRGLEEIERGPDPELPALVADLKSRVRFPGVGDEHLAHHAALILWQRRWAERERLNGIAIQCWSDLPTELGLWPCFANGEVTGAGIPVGCETDVHAALTGLMLQAAADAPTFCADLTVRHPTEENVELLWHCGPFPSCLAAEGAEREVSGYPNDPGVAGLAQWPIRGGPVTIARLDGDRGEYSLFPGQGEGVEGPYTRGTYLWLRVGDWPLWEQKLVYGPYIHHVTGVHGHVAPILYEACKYLPGLRPDPVEPDAHILEAWWRRPA